MKPLDISTARQLIDFSGGQKALESLGEMQLEGAVALHNIIADPDVGMGYLADEVGMGKTYVALGVVALMRYFNPALRVLYICPSRNVQEKWQREYLSFIKFNVTVNQFKIRTVSGQPAAPYINCRNVQELIAMSASGNYADFFIGKDSFSLSLTDDENQWSERLKSLRELVPAYEWDGVISDKIDVKKQYARVLNYVLPTFDLVVIDEAHNFKHGFETSDRNKVLSRVLGFYDSENFVPRVRNALLLSATPYDRNLLQLYNQLKLVGKQALLPEPEQLQPQEAKHYLRRFMVRRLNQLEINGIPHTRNMYRIEHRKGEKAEIALVSDEQMLVTALVQKKVGEKLDKAGSTSSFQTGMLASFESYSQTAKTERVTFDEVEEGKQVEDAQDRQLIDILSSTYQDSGLGRTLPHPKMDQVSKQLNDEVIHHGRKQLVFVRRVKSVAELKEKLDDHYNSWLHDYITAFCAGHKALASLFHGLFEQYFAESRTRDNDISEGEYQEGKPDEEEVVQPPKNDTFFSWFFRGETKASVDNYTTPDLLRKALTSKNRKNSLLMEINWAQEICRHHKADLSLLLAEHQAEISESIHQFLKHALTTPDYIYLYRACQAGFVNWYRIHTGIEGYSDLVAYLEPVTKPDKEGHQLNANEIKDYLNLATFYTEVETFGMTDKILPLKGELLESISNGDNITAMLDKLDVHLHLISICLRTGHGIIDLYLNCIMYGNTGKSGEESNQEWLGHFVRQLSLQDPESLSTYRELSSLAEQLDLIIKTNIPQIFDIARPARRKYLSTQLNPISPIIGATGETYNIRSAQARKFRMPGYPMVLISTDVFQEGEDLHTFCDSVTHYGISGSPINIEQKIGRVDRVNSMAQRRLLSYKKEQLDASALIQVTFPYVKQSIERLQISQACLNMNAFISSLHELGGDNTSILDIVDLETSLRNQSEIPDQIKAFLKTPYQVDSTILKGDAELELVDNASLKTLEIIEHVQLLLYQLCGVKIDLNSAASQYTNSTGTFEIKLDSARTGGFPTLSLTIGALDNDYVIGINDLEQEMRVLSWNTPHRIQADEIATGRYKLNRNVEILVGDANLTQLNDIQDAFNRLADSHALNYAHPSTPKIIGYCQKLAVEGIRSFNTKTIIKLVQQETNSSLALEYAFTHDAITRKHVVSIYEDDGYCIFVTKAVSVLKLTELKRQREQKIIHSTWQRNSYTDIVEFLLDPDGDINGRIIHPTLSLDYDEFVFCAYMLAAQADRLEYIFSERDEF